MIRRTVGHRDRRPVRELHVCRAEVLANFALLVALAATTGIALGMWCGQ